LADDGLWRPELSRSARVLWTIAACLAAAAASTLTTAGAAAAAGRQADLALQPVELALRVGLLLAAPCAGALLAAVVLPRGGGRPVLVAVGVGVPIGPLLVLRLDRMREFGPLPALLTVAVLVLWGLAGATLAAGWWRRPARSVERTTLPGADPEPGSEVLEPGSGTPEPGSGVLEPGSGVLEPGSGVAEPQAGASLADPPAAASQPDPPAGTSHPPWAG
jgi:hypothetical protein